MVRAGDPDVAALMAQLAANAAEIAALKAEKEALSRRVVKLEEELALARLHRFAPRSEKHVDRIFNEAEGIADEDDRDYATRSPISRTQACQQSIAPRAKSGAADLYPRTCRGRIRPC